MTAARRSAFFLWLLAGFLAYFISQHYSQASTEEALDPLSRFFGSAKEAFGDTLFLKADVYFHGGATNEQHHDETAQAFGRQGIIHEDKEPVEQAPKDWIAKINREVHVHELMHLSKEKRKEMLPFFAMATALDPHNVEAVLTTAFWLDREFDRLKDAIEVLERGIRDNPSSWEIENALGHLYFRQKNAWPFAERHLTQALKKSAVGKIDDYERVDIFYHLAEARMALGERSEALDAYRQASRFFDEKTAPYLRATIQDKIKELATG